METAEIIYRICACAAQIHYLADRNRRLAGDPSSRLAREEVVREVLDLSYEVIILRSELLERGIQVSVRNGRLELAVAS